MTFPVTGTTRDVSDLSPPDATMTDATNQRRCWMCGFYSFKVYGGDDDSRGKCFRDHKKDGKVWYVNGLMTCPGFILDDTVEEQ